jgi:Flp pilus assembly protein TadG
MKDRGSATVEMVLLTPVLVALVLFVLFAGRAGTTVEQLRHAADQGARAASLVSAPRQWAAAEAAVFDDLERNGVGCVRATVRLTAGRLGRTSTVRVTVTCTIDTSSTSLLGLDVRTVEASSTEAIDVHRGGV